FAVGDTSGENVGAVEMTQATTYYIWLDFQKGSGNGYCKGYISTSDSKPAVSAELTSRSVNVDLNRVQLLIFKGENDNATFDNIIVDDALL
ncbi:MAG TPA: hypothetical protein VMW34_15010, partial [Anaerolineales bacterium]|nr:hypothetical protein [Anaerolineales bacterium]